jgi:hypothetical protein
MDKSDDGWGDDEDDEDGAPADPQDLQVRSR